MAVYKDEEKGTWYAKFRYTDWTGKSRSTTRRGFRTKKEAKEFEVDFKRTSSGLQTGMTVEDLCKRYLEAMKPRWKERSYELQAQAVRLYIVPVIGQMKLSEVTKQTIIGWQNWILAKGLSASTVNAKNGVLTAIFNFAVRLDWMQKSPAAGIRKVGAIEKRLDFWEKSQYDRFIDAGRKHKDFSTYHLCFDILFYGGLRVGELLGLGCSSFDFEKGKILILHAVNVKTGKKTTPKNKQSYRQIIMPPSIMDRIKAYYDSLYGGVPEVNMFHMTHRRLSTHLEKWSKEAGMPYINIHGLRHSHASYLISLGIPITAISRRMGHNSPKVTLDVYSHMYKDDEAAVARILENALVGQSAVNAKKEKP